MHSDQLAEPQVLAAAALLVGGVILARLAESVRFPALLLFLALGMLIGDDGLNLISLNDAELAQDVGVVAVVVILFAGGLGTRPADIRQAAVPGLLLATAGVAITAAVVAAGALLVLDVEPLTAALTGAVVASTDAAAIFSVLRGTPLPRRLRALLEVESGANDPIAAMLTIGLLETARTDVTGADWVAFGLLQLGGGLLVGLAAGALGILALNRLQLGSTSLYPVLALGMAGLAYGTAAAAGASGFLAVYLAGYLIATYVPRHRRAIRSFHSGLANTAQIAVFLVLGLLVFPSQLPVIALPALAVTAILVLVARPLAVAVCLTPLRVPLREQVLVGWAGLRGAFPIVLATFALTGAYAEGGIVFDVTFFLVLVSTAIQGLTIAPLARRLGRAEPAPAWGPVAEALPLEGMGADLVEVDISSELHVAGKKLDQVPLPEGALLTAIVRGRRAMLPSATVRLQPGDKALVAVPAREGSTRQIVAWARGEWRPPPRPEPPEPGDTADLRSD
jgi:potassium/hydrogen antiporter